MLQYLYLILGAFVLLVAVVSTLRYRANRARSFDMVFLRVLIPRKESEKDKQDTTSGNFQEGFKEVNGIMEQFLSNLHGIKGNKLHTFLFGRDYISLEYACIDGEVSQYIVAPRRLIPFIEKQITSFYPEAVAEPVEEYQPFAPDSKQATTYMYAVKPFGYPIRTYKWMESDPVNSVINSLSKMDPGESGMIQIMLRPKSNGWQKKVKKIASHLQEGHKKSFSLNPIRWIAAIIDLLTGDSSKPVEKKPTPLIDEAIRALGEKSNAQGYKAAIRIVTSAATKHKAHENLYNIAKTFAQYSTPELNHFDDVQDHSNRRAVVNFILRTMRIPLRSFFLRPKMVLSTTEIASIFHFPNTKYNRVNAIKWQNYKIAPAPPNLPKDGLMLGYNLYRGVKTPVYMKRADRFRHFYVIGQTGTGKSTMLVSMIRQDLINNDGFCCMDPHGQLADDIFPHIPRHRADDVIYFNPADTERPMGLNLLEGKTEEERELVALDAMNIMIKLFGNEIFGPRIQDYFRNGCLTLMSDPEGGALTDIVRLFTDDVFQQYKVTKVKNPIVKAFWEKQMASTGMREKQEMIPYFAAKFGQFTTNALMRNIIGQVKSAFDINEVMNTGKILIINLSKGLIGDINSNLLGLIMVSKIQTAAMRRQRQDKAERKDFFLYIDEFQNYITDAIESILSEARKYRLGLAIAHQYIGQLEKKQGPDQGTLNMKDAIFGNVGTVMAYKIGAQDAEYMEKEFAPVFSQQDLIGIDARKAAIKLSIDTQPSRPFSIIPIYYGDKGDNEVVEAYKQLSRLKYGRDRDFVNREIIHRVGAA